MGTVKAFGKVRSIVRLVYLLTAPLVVLSPAAAQNEPVVFNLFETQVDESGIKVFNGTQTIGGNWSSILLAEMPAASGLNSCTATLVGQNVLLTAAHCVDQGTAVARDVALRIGASTLSFSCKMSDEYASGFPFAGALRAYEDYALCWIKPGAGSVPARFLSLRRETIDVAPLTAGSPVLITGYGCTSMTVDLDSATIETPPFVPGLFSAGDETIDRVDSPRVSTFSTRAIEPALCKGDSGGPLITGASVADPDGNRRVRGINSQVIAEQSGLRSQFAALSSEAFRRFVACWHRTHPALLLEVSGQLGSHACSAQ